MSNGVKVLVSGLSHDVCKKDLLKFFHKKVKIIAMDNGKAFVEFDSYPVAVSAIYELNGRELYGKRVSIELPLRRPRGSNVWRGDDLPTPPPRLPRFDARDNRNHRYSQPTRPRSRSRSRSESRSHSPSKYESSSLNSLFNVD